MRTSQVVFKIYAPQSEGSYPDGWVRLSMSVTLLIHLPKDYWLGYKMELFYRATW